MADEVLAVERLSQLIAGGALAAVYHELQSPLWEAADGPARPPPHPSQALSLLDRPDSLDRLPLCSALEASSWRQDALQMFSLLLERGADPDATNCAGRRVEWELRGQEATFKDVFDSARVAKRQGNQYEMPFEMKSDMETMHQAYCTILQEEEDDRAALAEQVKRANAAAAAVQAQKRAAAVPPISRLPAGNVAETPPSRLPSAEASESASVLKRPLDSRLLSEPVKRARLDTLELDDLPDYEDVQSNSKQGSPEDVKPVISRLPPPRRPSHTPGASPLPPTRPSPGSGAVLVRFRRLPPYTTVPILTRWLTYGPLVFDGCAAESALVLMDKGYYKKMPRFPPPRPVSVEMVKTETQIAPEGGASGAGVSALVGYKDQEEAWKAKQAFDTLRLLPKCTREQLIEVTLL